jgi:hypothetical protein
LISATADRLPANPGKEKKPLVEAFSVQKLPEEAIKPVSFGSNKPF